MSQSEERSRGEAESVGDTDLRETEMFENGIDRLVVVHLAFQLSKQFDEQRTDVRVR